MHSARSDAMCMYNHGDHKTIKLSERTQSNSI